MWFKIGKKEDIEKIPTKVLLKAFKRRGFINEGFGSEPVIGYPAHVDILFEHAKYTIPREELKVILDQRPHYETDKKKRKILRQKKAKNGSN